jgi:parallel beta-helix repeat protein/predicted outer membrane repeat protein
MRYSVLIAKIICIFTISVSAKTILVPVEESTIQKGIDAACDGDTVLVSEGTYAGEGNRDIDFLGKAIVVRSDCGPEKTIIDCEGSHSTNHRGFIFQNGEGYNAVLQGFTIKNGYESGIFLDSMGGGILCYRSSPTIAHCILMNNYACWYGGGISCRIASPLISNCIVVENNAVIGGGVSCSTASPTIRNCTVVDNTASSTGGGIYLSNSYSTITGCIFWMDSPQEMHMSESDVIVTYSDVTEGWTGEGNIDADPLFVDPENRDYRLQQDSPCIDAGDPYSRLDENASLNDMGAYGGMGDLPPMVLGGAVSGIFTREGSPYIISERVVVEKGSSLKIEPGVTILFHNRSSMEIRGRVRAIGTAANPIAWTRFQPWDRCGGIIFKRAAGELHCNTVEYGLVPDGGGICCRASAVHVTECEFRGNETYSGGSGGAIYCCNSVVLIEECDFIENHALSRGGAICCEKTQSRITDCNFTGNYGAMYGGAIASENSSSTTVKNCVVKGNAADFTGGGIYIYACDDTEICNCVISGNYSDYSGGGIGCWTTFSEIKNCILSCNEAATSGGGVYCYHAHPAIMNCTFHDNRAAESGGGIFFWGRDAAAVNSILWDNSPDEIYVLSGDAAISYSDIKGGWQGEGNIDADPLFVTFLVYGFEYLLRPASPCIDTGDPAVEDSLYDHHPRWPDWYPDGARSDMGAYGGPGNIDWVR